MTNHEADVTLVLETANDRPDKKIRFADVVKAWREQTRTDRILEWLVVAGREPTPLESDLLSGAPLRWLLRPNLTYYQQKNVGLAEARGAFAVLADSDAFPAEDWLERALDTMEQGGPSVALVAGRSRYLPGRFKREMELAQLGEHDEQPHDTGSFLAHNAMVRTEAVRATGLFHGDAIRLGSDTDLARRLTEAGYRLRFDPSVRATHTFSDLWESLYRTTVGTGRSHGLFEMHLGKPRRGPIRDFVGRMRVLLGRWMRNRRSVGIPLRRFPISLLIFGVYCLAVGHGRSLAIRGKSLRQFG